MNEHIHVKKSVLIVDDEPQIGKIFGLALELAGFDVMSTTKGKEALNLVRNRKFDVVLLDIFMSEMTGFEVLEKIRAFSQVPVFVFTARQDIQDMAIGSDGFIAKPLNPDKLVIILNDFFANKERTNVKQNDH